MTQVLIPGPTSALGPQVDAFKREQSSISPPLVLAESAMSADDVFELPNNTAFLVSGAWTPSILPDGTISPDDIFANAGAEPNSIGWHNKVGALGEFAFTPAKVNDVVWSLASNTLLRFERDRGTNTVAWKSYRSMPERALDGIPVVATFDPDGVYANYARMIGGYCAQVSKDALVIREMRDPQKVPKDYLAVAAQNIGESFDDSSSEAQQRHRLESSVPTARARGTAPSVPLRLIGLGYNGTALERWVKISWPVCCFDGHAVNGVYDNTFVLTTSAPTRIYVAGMTGGTEYSPAHGTVWFNPTGLPVSGDILTCTGPGGFGFKCTFGVTIPIADGPAMMSALKVWLQTKTFHLRFYTTANDVPDPAFLTETPAQSGVSGKPFRDYLHGANIEAPERYWPSKYIAITYVTSQGAPVFYPVPVAGVPVYQRQDYLDHEAIKSALSLNTLPAHVTVGAWGTQIVVEELDEIVAGDSVGKKSAGIKITETFSSTRINLLSSDAATLHHTVHIDLPIYFGTYPLSGTTPNITSSNSITGSVGSPLSFWITAVNGPTIYSVALLPTGLSVDSQTGQITGIPTVAGITTGTVYVSNQYGTASQSVTFTIA